MNKMIRIILFFILLGVFNSFASAGIRVKHNLSENIRKAEKIVRAKVVLTQSQWIKDQRGQHIYTTVYADVLEKIKGNIPDDFISFEVIGGTVGDITERVSDSVEFKTDDEAIILLQGNPLTIKRGTDSKIPIHNGKIYQKDRQINADNFIRSIKALQNDPNSEVSLDQFKVQDEQEPNAECYIYNGYKWSGASPNVSYKINENTGDCNGEGAAVQAAANTWNNAAANFKFNYAGAHTQTVSSRDGVNEILWGTTDESIATTYTWFSGTTILECDTVFDDSYDWSSTTPTSSQMDVQTIALHELGHWLSLADLYNDEDSGNVMYGYGDYGEVKRELQPCDIEGICSIYGCPSSFTLTVNSTGVSGVSITSSSGQGGTTNYTSSVSTGSVVSLTAPATAGSKVFNGWTGSVISANQTISFTMNGNKSVAANYITPPPSNDMFANAITITGLSGHTTGSNAGATKETGEPNHAGRTGGVSVWWQWTAPADGNASIDTFGSNFDTLLGIYTGDSVTNLTLIASNDDSGGSQQSKAVFTAVSGTIYKIAVDGYGKATGNISLNWSLIPNYTLSVNSSGASAVSISSSTGHSGTTNYIKSVASGTNVSLTAPVVWGTKSFTGWTGDVTSNEATISFLMDGAKTVTANYATTSYTLNVNSSGASSADITSSTGQGGTTSYSVTVLNDANVELTAPVNIDGNSFKEWQRNGTFWTNTRTADFTMDSDYTFTAVYEQIIPSPSNVDLNKDGIPNFEDLTFFAAYWQNADCVPPGWCDYTDINRDGIVDFKDLEIFAEYWLATVTE